MDGGVFFLFGFFCIKLEQRRELKAFLAVARVWLKLRLLPGPMGSKKKKKKRLV